MAYCVLFVVDIGVHCSSLHFQLKVLLAGKNKSQYSVAKLLTKTPTIPASNAVLDVTKLMS